MAEIHTVSVYIAALTKINVVWLLMNCSPAEKRVLPPSVVGMRPSIGGTASGDGGARGAARHRSPLIASRVRSIGNRFTRLAPGLTSLGLAACTAPRRR